MATNPDSAFQSSLIQGGRAPLAACAISRGTGRAPPVGLASGCDRVLEPARRVRNAWEARQAGQKSLVLLRRPARPSPPPPAQIRWRQSQLKPFVGCRFGGRNSANSAFLALRREALSGHPPLMQRFAMQPQMLGQRVQGATLRSHQRASNLRAGPLQRVRSAGGTHMCVPTSMRGMPPLQGAPGARSSRGTPAGRRLVVTTVGFFGRGVGAATGSRDSQDTLVPDGAIKSLSPEARRIFREASGRPRACRGFLAVTRPSDAQPLPPAAGPRQHHRAEQEPPAGARGAQGGAAEDCRAG